MAMFENNSIGVMSDSDHDLMMLKCNSLYTLKGESSQRFKKLLHDNPIVDNKRLLELMSRSDRWVIKESE